MEREAPFDAVYPDRWGFLCGTSGKESVCQCRRSKRPGFDPWVGKIPWRRARQPTSVFLPMDRGAWQATIHRVTQSRTQVKRLSMQAPRKTGRGASLEEGTGQHRKGVGALRGIFSPASATASLDLHKTQSLALLGRRVTSSLFTTAGTAECLPSSHAPLVQCWYSALQSHG